MSDLTNAPRRWPALSIKQPWAWAILHANKRLENRDGWTSCRHRGWIWLHASKDVGTVDEFHEAIALIGEHAPIGDIADVGRRRPRGGKVAERWVPSEQLLRGGIVGRARIDGTVCNERDFTALCERHPGSEGQRAWLNGGAPKGLAIALTDVHPVPFTPVLGALGLFAVPQEIEMQLRSMIERGE